MGIPKLTTFIDRHFSRWKREKICGKLVIDGKSLCYHLYSFDWRYGGQYPQFHECILEHFKALSMSGIEAIVVYDGVDYKQEKVKTTMKRRKEMIQSIKLSAGSTPSACNVIPLLAIEEFQHTLHGLNVTQVVCDGEADLIIAKLANYYICPVLSKDSDFYMYALRGGFIHTNKLQWNRKPILADVYYVSAFVDQFKLQHESVRLIIPTFVGNDFLPPVSAPNAATDVKYHSILSLVHYSRQFEHFDDFISKSSSVGKDDLQFNCLYCKEVYDCTVVCSLDDVMTNTELLKFDKSVIPRWIIDQYKRCNFGISLMEVYVLQKCILRVAIDDYHLESSLIVSRQLRKVIYNMLNIEIVTEYVRHKIDIVGEKVGSFSGRKLPRLELIPFLNLSEKSTMLCLILGCNVDEIEKLDVKWRLVTASVVYWMLHTKVPTCTVKALLLGFMYCFDSNLLRKCCDLKVPNRIFDSHKCLSIIHYFAQWQSIYFDVVSLNQVLQLPLETLPPSQLYDGSVVVYFASVDQGITSAEANLSGTLQSLYKVLIQVVFAHSNAVVPANVTKPKRIHKKPSFSATKPKASSAHSMFEHANRFSALCIDSSEELSSTESD